MSNKKIILIVVAMIAAVAIVGIGYRLIKHCKQDRHPHNLIHGMFERMDHNKDLQIDMQEFNKLHQRLLKKLDKNQNGLLEKEELLNQKSHRASKALLLMNFTTENQQGVNIKQTLLQHFKNADSDQNQMLSKQELKKFVSRTAFTKLDQNGDNQLSYEEFSSRKGYNTQE